MQRGALAGREFWRCESCQFVHVPSHFHVSVEAERAIYDLHENRPDDPGYRQFLSRLLTPMLPQLPIAASGLDFGCGPGPALPFMFAEHDHFCTTYDVFYANYPERLEQTYDFITATEVVEHLSAPMIVFDQLLSCLKPDGLLGIMTQRWDSRERFRRWQYRNDPTHIGFFHEQTFHWLAKKFALQLTIYPRDVVIFQKTYVLRP